MPSALRREQGLSPCSSGGLQGVGRASISSLILGQMPISVRGGECPRPRRPDQGLWGLRSYSQPFCSFLFPGSEGRVQLVVPGSCEGPQEASVGTASRFHCLACWEPELSIHLQVCATAP